MEWDFVMAGYGMSMALSGSILVFAGLAVHAGLTSASGYLYAMLGLGIAASLASLAANVLEVIDSWSF